MNRKKKFIKLERLVNDTLLLNSKKFGIICASKFKNLEKC